MPPVTAAATANWKPTTPEASLSSASPYSRAETLRSRLAVSEREDTATASVGPRAKPSAKAAARGMVGNRAWTPKPTAMEIATTKPMASERMIVRFFQRPNLSEDFAS